MSLSSYMEEVYGAERMPAWAQLEWRQAIVNGQGPNVIVDGLAANDRPMGVMPQQRLEVTAVADAGGPLAAATAYTYGIQRVVRLGGLEVPSAMTLASVSPSAASKGSMAVAPYEYEAEAGALWDLVYRIFRSKAGAPTMLYLVEELDAADLETLTWTYVDTTAEANLNLALAYSTSVPDANGWVPPCRFVRSWRGRFVLGGALERRVGSVTIAAGDLETVMCPEEWTVQPSDVGAQLRIAGLAWVYTISAVDATAGTYTLTGAAPAAVSAAEAWLFRPDGRVYVTNPQPGNVEGYTLGTEVQRADGAGEPLEGLAVHGAYCYILHARGLLMLEAAGESVAVVPFPGGAPGCVSHASVADGPDSPALYYYAGAAGVVEVRGTQVRNIGLMVERVLRERVDHSMDGWTHGVYDASRGWYLLWLFAAGGVHTQGMRVPELCLVWDSAAERWYEFELAAVTSAVWRSAAGGAVVVLGLPDGLGVLADEAPGDVERLEGTVAAGDVFGAGTWTPVVAVTATGLAGLPLHFEALDGAVYRYLITGVDEAGVTVAGSFAPVPAAGWRWRIGAVRWAAETGIVAANLPEGERVERVLVLHEPAAGQEVEAELRGVRHRAGERVSLRRAMDGAGEVDMRAVGLRGRGFALRLAGDGWAPVRFQQVLVETSEVKRHE